MRAWTCVLVLVVCVCVTVKAWPREEGRYRCYCSQDANCAPFPCRNTEFVCNCGDCSCFHPEKPNKPVVDMDSQLQHLLQSFDDLLSS